MTLWSRPPYRRRECKILILILSDSGFYGWQTGSLKLHFLSSTHLTKRGTKINDTFWGQVTANWTLTIFSCWCILSVIVDIEAASSGLPLVGERLSFRRFWCCPFVLPAMRYDVEMSRELVGVIVKKKLIS